MKLFILSMLTLSLIFSCETTTIDDCSDIACFPGPPIFIFEIVDKQSNENLFTNGTLDSSEIRVVDEDGDRVAYEFISRDSLNVIDLTTIGWNLGERSYTMTLGASLEIHLQVLIVEKHQNCCSYYDVVDFSVTDYEYELTNPELYTIKI